MHCRNCGFETRVFYEQAQVPVNSVLLLRSREEAARVPRGDISLGWCAGCGLISNLKMDMRLVRYNEHYNPSQTGSPTFRSFQRALAERLVETRGLKNKNITDVGCGSGEFLTLLCDLGDNRGVGYDPACTAPGSERVSFVREYYSTANAPAETDFLCCQMTLEHVLEVRSFLRAVRDSVSDSTLVYFQVPNAEAILSQSAFWDVYYEHCSYFTPASLLTVFEENGFEVVGVQADFEGQYLMLEARKGALREGRSRNGSTDEDRIVAFQRDVGQRIADWQAFLQQGGRTVVWGGGSKGVSFLNAVDKDGCVRHVVDIDVKKHGTYIAGTAQEIVSPERLRDIRPDTVLIMNPIYEPEIKSALSTLGLHCATRSL